MIFSRAGFSAENSNSSWAEMELDVIASNEGKTHVWWTSGTDMAFNGRWIWATSLTAVDVYVWHSSQPASTLSYNCRQI